MIVKIYQNANGREPLTDWFYSLNDRRTQSRILRRFKQLEYGQFGDHKALGSGLFELRFFFGAGYLVYFGKDGETLLLLLCGGDKDSQARDIERAKIYWQNYQESKK